MNRNVFNANEYKIIYIYVYVYFQSYKLFKYADWIKNKNIVNIS